jgi:hypothetical protein
VWASGCQSWYQQADGKNFTIWPFSTWKYWLRTRQVRTEHYDFVKARSTVSSARKEKATA